MRKMEARVLRLSLSDKKTVLIFPENVYYNENTGTSCKAKSDKGR